VSRGESGQTAVETALSLPLVLFCVLGSLQLFLMFNARILTQLAAYRAARAGSMNHGNCARMVDAAILQVIPAVESFMRPGPGTPGAKLAAAYARRRTNRYSDVISNGGKKLVLNDSVVWIIRDVGPRPPPVGNTSDDDFDMGLTVMRMEATVVFWFPMRIPFANWVMSKMFLAHFGVQDYTAVNPLIATQKGMWSSRSPQGLNAAIVNEMSTRMNRGELVFPITANYTMRMMTPAKGVNFMVKNCAPTPQSI
jgi:hypothetical protein